jgi:hypothetical protein
MHDRRYVENLRTAFELYPAVFQTVKADHPGPRGKPCTGGAVRVMKENLAGFRQGKPVEGICYGCNFIGIVSRKTSN